MCDRSGVSSVPVWFRADSGTNLIKQGEIVTGRPYGSVAQCSECSHGVREVLGSSPGRAMCFCRPCDKRSYIFMRKMWPNVIQTGFQMPKFLNFATLLSREPHFQDS